MFRSTSWVVAVVFSLCSCAASDATTTVFFDSSQVAVDVASGVTSDTISSSGYLFTYTRDKLFTGGIGMTEPIGRPVRVPWPQGVEAQAVTTPPPGVTNYKARIRLQRVDGDVFDMTAFTAKLLANTVGTGGSIEIMPLLNGEDAFSDPLYFDASGIAGNTFSYDTTPNYLGSTALLTGFDRYDINLFVDFALTSLTLNSAATWQLPGDYDADGMLGVSDIDLQAVAMHEPQPNLTVFDENADGAVNKNDRLIWVHAHAGTWVGDANLDGQFNSADFVHVFAAGNYETGQFAGWAEGDWNGDGQFASSDFIAAFEDGGYELGLRMQVVPEPGAATLSVIGLALWLIVRRTSSPHNERPRTTPTHGTRCLLARRWASRSGASERLLAYARLTGKVGLLSERPTRGGNVRGVYAKNGRLPVLLSPLPHGPPGKPDALRAHASAGIHQREVVRRQLEPMGRQTRSARGKVTTWPWDRKMRQVWPGLIRSRAGCRQRRAAAVAMQARSPLRPSPYPLPHHVLRSGHDALENPPSQHVMGEREPPFSPSFDQPGFGRHSASQSDVSERAERSSARWCSLSQRSPRPHELEFHGVQPQPPSGLVEVHPENATLAARTVYPASPRRQYKQVPTCPAGRGAGMTC